jgi:tripeptide aminopeptidase
MTVMDIAIDTQRILETFLDLVRLDSPSGEEGPVRDYLTAWLTQHNIAFELDASGNIFATVPGNSAGKQTLAVTGHMDVVPPCIGVKPIVEGEGVQTLIRSDGTTVLGADDKSGLAAMLEALDLSLAQNLPRPNLLFLFTVREEVMLMGAQEIDPKKYQHADFVIALDHTGDINTLIYEAPTYIRWKMTVHGKSVHAGIMPEKGINAIKVLSEALTKITFGRLDENTTSNVSFIKGGKATNIVPDLATAEGELRSHDPKRLETELALYKQILGETVGAVEGASCEFEHTVNFEHYATDKNHPGLKNVANAMHQMGLEPNFMRTNGGSDVNVFAKHGVPGIVLTAGYMEPHSLKERVYLKDITACTQLLLATWEQFSHV